MAEAPVTTYAPGNWVVVAGAGAWFLVCAAPGDPLVAEAWEQVRSGDVSTVDRAVRRAAEQAARSFGLVTATGASVTLLLSGPARAAVTIDGTVELLQCPAGASVAEYRLDRHPARLIVSAGEASLRGLLPLTAGAAHAGAMVLDWQPGVPVTATGRPPATPTEPADHGPARSLAGLPSATTARGAATLPSSLAPAPHPAEDLRATSTATTGAADEFTGGDSEDGRHDRRPRDETLGGQPPDDDDDYDHLFGQTVGRSVEDAAVRAAVPAGTTAGTDADAPQGVPAPSRPPSAPESGQPPSPDTVRPTSTAAPPSAAAPLATAPPFPGGIIDAVPGASPGRRADPEVERAPLAPIASEDLTMTVNRAAQAKMLAQMERPGSLAAPGPVVHAIRCPSQHPNPAHAGTCRVCRAAIPDQVPVTVPRPVLGRLRFSSGDEVTLDRGVLMGRKPAEGRQVGGERPHLVKLSSPQHDISRTHLEVRLDGWHVLVTDLDSTNGTLVAQPGRPQERLRPGQPTMIEPGTMVVLADDVTFVFEVD
jgi:hypothetical protein